MLLTLSLTIISLYSILYSLYLSFLVWYNYTFLWKGRGGGGVQVEFTTDVLCTPSSTRSGWNLWLSDHDSIFHATETPALTTRPSVTSSFITVCFTIRIWHCGYFVLWWWYHAFLVFHQFLVQSFHGYMQSTIVWLLGCGLVTFCIVFPQRSVIVYHRILFVTRLYLVHSVLTLFRSRPVTISCAEIHYVCVTFTPLALLCLHSHTNIVPCIIAISESDNLIHLVYCLTILQKGMVMNWD